MTASNDSWPPAPPLVAILRGLQPERAAAIGHALFEARVKLSKALFMAFAGGNVAQVAGEKQFSVNPGFDNRQVDWKPRTIAMDGFHLKLLS